MLKSKKFVEEHHTIQLNVITNSNNYATTFNFQDNTISDSGRTVTPKDIQFDFPTLPSRITAQYSQNVIKALLLLIIKT